MLFSPGITRRHWLGVYRVTKFSALMQVNFADGEDLVRDRLEGARRVNRVFAGPAEAGLLSTSAARLSD
jgi:hypothetical protein